MSWDLTWAWAQRESTLYMTTLRSHQSSRSSNSLLANTAAQQVGVLLLVFFFLKKIKGLNCEGRIFQESYFLADTWIQQVTEKKRWQQNIATKQAGGRNRGCFKQQAPHPLCDGVLRKQIYTNSMGGVCFRSLHLVSYRPNLYRDRSMWRRHWTQTTQHAGCCVYIYHSELKQHVLQHWITVRRIIKFPPSGMQGRNQEWSGSKMWNTT